jgi:hypothetical protein
LLVEAKPVVENSRDITEKGRNRREYGGRRILGGLFLNVESAGCPRVLFLGFLPVNDERSSGCLALRYRLDSCPSGAIHKSRGELQSPRHSRRTNVRYPPHGTTTCARLTGIHELSFLPLGQV